MAGMPGMKYLFIGFILELVRRDVVRTKSGARALHRLAPGNRTRDFTRGKVARRVGSLKVLLWFDGGWVGSLKERDGALVRPVAPHHQLRLESMMALMISAMI